MPTLEMGCIRFFDGLPTVKCSVVKRPMNRVLRVERGDGGRVLMNASSNFIPNARTCSSICESTVSFSWAKVGNIKLIANPTRATAKRIFIDSHPAFRTICRGTTCCGVSRDRCRTQRAAILTIRQRNGKHYNGWKSRILVPDRRIRK